MFRAWRRIRPRLKTLYAGTLTIGVQKSVDGGATWTGVNDGLGAQQNGSISVGNALGHPTAPNVIFAGTGYGLMRSSSGGAGWAAVAGGNVFSTVAFDGFNAGTVCFGSGNHILKSTR